MSVNRSHKASIRATRIVYTTEHRVLVKVAVTCSCRASMVRRFRMRERLWFKGPDAFGQFTDHYGGLGCDDIYTSTEARARWGASRCPALICAVLNTNASAGVPVTLDAAVRILRGEDA